MYFYSVKYDRHFAAILTRFRGVYKMVCKTTISTYLRKVSSENLIRRVVLDMYKV